MDAAMLESLEPDTQTQRRVIMVVDTVPIFREAFQRVLERGGYQVLAVARGDEASEVLTGKGQHVDLLLTDIPLEGIDGFELINRVRQVRPRDELPIMVISDQFQSPEDIKEMRDNGVAGYISKYYLQQGGVQAGLGWVSLVLAASSLLNAAYFLPIIYRAWFLPQPDEWPEEHHFGRLETGWMLLVPPIFTAAMVVLAGILAEAPFSPLAFARMIAGEEFPP